MSVQKYSEQEIEEVLRQIKELVSLNKFIISTSENRVKNDEFADEFNLDKEKRKQLILKIGFVIFVTVFSLLMFIRIMTIILYLVPVFC
ncbi:Uncharacterised protein [Streptococcus suis]|uniref:Uncharacterized protein n=1 Tax=Streptococcus suis TaxID=1307 RepID=A0AB33UDC9_STRSU|nr:Uncharacterised protein [Streptococcus suis]CYX43966.1 Uncharacterised protein [Streptococcus suis]